jgi:hypothetical protein
MRQRPCTTSGRVFRSLPSRIAWRLAVERHLHDDLIVFGRGAPDDYVAIIASLSDLTWSAAVDTEMRKRGAGLQVVLESPKPAQGSSRHASLGGVSGGDTPAASARTQSLKSGLNPSLKSAPVTTGTGPPTDNRARVFHAPKEDQ